MYYSLRITTNDNLKTKLEELMQKIKAKKYLFTVETGNDTLKRHYQGAITTETKLQTIRVNFKKVFTDIRGNENYSLKSRYTPMYSKRSIPCDENIYAYCAKENNELQTEDVTNLTKEEFKGYNLKYYEKKKDFDILSKNNKKARKEKKDNLFQSAVTFLVDGNYTLNKKPILPEFQTGDQIVEKLISFYEMDTIILEYGFNEQTFKWIYVKIIALYYKDIYREYMVARTKYLTNQF